MREKCHCHCQYQCWSPSASKLDLKKFITAVTPFLTCPTKTFCCFYWQLRTAFPPVCMYHLFPRSCGSVFPRNTNTYWYCFVLGVVKIYLPFWFIHPEISALYNERTRKRHFYPHSVFPRGLPFLNCMITFRMVSCGHKWNALLLFLACSRLSVDRDERKRSCLLFAPPNYQEPGIG